MLQIIFGFLLESIAISSRAVISYFSSILPNGKWSINKKSGLNSLYALISLSIIDLFTCCKESLDPDSNSLFVLDSLSGGKLKILIPCIPSGNLMGTGAPPETIKISEFGFTLFMPLANASVLTKWPRPTL